MDSPNEPSVDSNTKINISLLEIASYFGISKRPLRAGEELVNANFVYAIGIAPPPATGKILGLVIQTSSMSNTPHEVQLNHIEDVSENWKCNCSCKAGEGEKCKHVAACLIYIYRYEN